MKRPLSIDSTSPEALPIPPRDELDSELRAHLRRIPFRPHKAFRHGHANTIAAALWPRRTGTLARHRREWRLQLPGSTELLIDSYTPASAVGRRAIVIVHGLGGSSRSGYVRSTAWKALLLGYHVVALNIRNCGGTDALTSELYHAGLTEDLQAVVEHLHAERFETVHLCGFSLGGNMSLKLAAEYRGPAWNIVRGIVAISPCLDLPHVIDRLELPSNRIYHQQFVIACKALIRRKAQREPDRWDLVGLEDIRTLREFDARYTAPAAGFRDVEQYYAEASALSVLRRLEVPTLVIQARDDPLIPFHSFLKDELVSHPAIELLATKRGGHAAFLAARGPDSDRFWAEHRLLEFFEGLEALESRSTSTPGPG